MAIAEVRLADGRVVEIRVPDGATQEQVSAFVQQNMSSFQRQEQIPQDSTQSQFDIRFNELLSAGVPRQVAEREAARLSMEDPQGRLAGQAETAGLVATSIASEPVAGIAGLVSTPFVGGERAGQVVRDVRSALTPELSPAGVSEAQALAETISPVTDVIAGAEESLGERGFEAAGPLGGAIGTAIPTALTELLGVASLRGGARSAEKIRDISQAAPDERVSSILSAAEKADVPVLTSDLFPPESFVGRSIQSFSEKLGPLGSGSARTSQQRARIEAVESFADGIDIDTPFADSVVQSLNRKAAKKLEQAGNVRSQAISSLDEFGEFDSPKAISKIDEILTAQARLGETGNQQLVNELSKFKAELSKSSDFSFKKDQRTQLIKKINAFGRAEDTAPAADLQQVKSALDKDLTDFARKNDKTALRKWLSSNREFASELTKAKDTEIKRILQSGEATPEKVIPILRGGKPSELNRLYDSLGEKGRSAAKSTLIQQALKDSRFFDVDQTPNPDALATALNRPAFQQASKVFFRGSDKKELDGFNRLLNSTRSAQSGQAAPRTGEQLLIPGVAGGAVALDPATALTVIGPVSGLLKSYESKPFRNLLVRLSNTKPGTKLERQTLDLLATSVVSAQQAARTEQE